MASKSEGEGTTRTSGEIQGEPMSATASEVDVFCDGASTLLVGEVVLSKSTKTLTVTTKGLKLEGDTQVKEQQKTNFTVLWQDVISAETSGEGNDSNFSVHYILLKKDRKLQHQMVTLKSKTVEARKWVDVVQAQCQQIEGRPKNIFVVINPIGGGRQGRSMYQSKVAPLLKLAGCRTTVVETERSKHALEIGAKHDFTGFDGVLSVGGDGMFQELLQGYFVQLQEAARVNINDVDENFARPKIPFCLIPAGTSNGIVGTTNDGVKDAETSALRVLRGEIHPISIMTVHEPGKFLGVCALGVVSGLMTDIMKRTDELRWMKKARYPYAFVTGLLKKKRKFNLHLEFLQEDEVHVESGSFDSKCGWSVYDGDGKPYTQAFFSTMAILDLEDCTAVDPYAEASTVILDFGGTVMEFVKFAQAFGGKKVSREELPHLGILDNVKGMRLKIMRDPGETEGNASRQRQRERGLEQLLYFDGEIVKMEGLEIEARLKSRFVPMFGCIPTRLRDRNLL